MKKIFVIIYTGNQSSEIEQLVKAYGNWFHFSKDTYIISASTNAKALRTNLETKISQGKDKLLVLDVSIQEAEGWLTKDEWGWLNSERNKISPG